MGFLRSLLGKSKAENESSQFLAGWEVKLDGKEHCVSFLETHTTTKEIAEGFYAHIELTYNKNGVLERAEKRDEDGNIEDMLIGKGMQRKDYRLNPIFNFFHHPNAESHLGGSVPKYFEIPKNNCPGSFQYLGKISKNSIGFSWLPHDIDLICPIYMDIDTVWLDYSDHNAPTIINLEEVNTLTSAYGDLMEDSFIEYEKVPFSVIKGTQLAFDLGHSGLPNWIQFSDIPRCPRTHKTMRFLCQLYSSDLVLTSKTNIEPESEWYKQYFDKMNFWGDGDLFVFFEPDSKVACYIIQNT